MRFRSVWLALLLGVAIGVGLTLAVPTVAPYFGSALRQPATEANAATLWKASIAFQYYETQHEQPQFLADHVDWLMMRYGAEDIRNQVIKSGYSGVLPQYLLLFQISGPGPYANSQDSCENDYTPQQNNVMWTDDFCERVHEHEDWFLHNSNGERLYVRERIWNGQYIYQYYMNPGSKGFQSFWINQIRKQQAAGWQSFFLDNVAATYSYIGERADTGNGTVAEYESVEQWQDAVLGMLQTIQAAFPDHKVWGNIIESPPTADAWDYYRPELEGIQEENFATNWANQPPLTPDAWEAMITRAERTLADNRMVILYGQGRQGDQARMEFSFASYLLVATADNRAYFRYARSADYDTLWWYPEYDMNLGAPLGPRYREGNQWVRDFACARVAVDPATQTGVIEQHDCQVAG